MNQCHWSNDKYNFLHFVIQIAYVGFFWNYYGLYEIFKRLTIILPHHAVSKLLFEVLVNDASFVQNNVWKQLVLKDTLKN